MNSKVILIIICFSVLLVSCGGGPPNAVVVEKISQVYLYEARVVAKTECELPADLVATGSTQAWHVVVENKKTENIGDLFFVEEDGQWEIFYGFIATCVD